MNVLVLEWDSFAHEYVMEALKENDCQLDVFEWPFGKENMRENETLEERLAEHLKGGNYQFVFSFNFFPLAAKVCNQCGVKYVSWIYDSPYLLLYSKYVFLDTNYVYFFDKSLWREFKRKGLKNGFYLPMAAPVDYYDSLNKKAEKKTEYQSEISFVGSTYNEDRQNFFRYIENVNEYTSGYLKAIMNVQKEVYGSFLLEDLLTNNIIQELQRVCPIRKEEDEWETDAWVYANYFLARKITGEQRVEALDELSKLHRVKLYTAEKTPELVQVENCGPVDYVTEMPLVFKNSKINLNVTLRSIHSGIPLRAMDIMGCGGFLLTNYQEDFLDYFEPNVDYVFYSDKNEMLYLADYYLTHEDERMEIALNGYRKVKENHSYKDRVQLILTHMKEQ